jgi:hypothetical protein
MRGSSKYALAKVRARYAASFQVAGRDTMARVFISIQRIPLQSRPRMSLFKVRDARPEIDPRRCRTSHCQRATLADERGGADPGWMLGAPYSPSRLRPQPSSSCRISRRRKVVEGRAQITSAPSPLVLMVRTRGAAYLSINVPTDLIKNCPKFRSAHVYRTSSRQKRRD